MGEGNLNTEIRGTNKQIQTALKDVNLPNLLLVLASVTGSDEWLATKYQPAPVKIPEGDYFLDGTGRYSLEIQKEIRTAAVNILAEIRDGQRVLADPPDERRIQRMLSFSMAEDISDDYAAMLMEETRFRDRDVQWQPLLAEAIQADKGKDFTALIIGAGMSGIGIASKLKNAGINFSIVEKNDQVGGVWYENTYPDCGVDTPNHYYSYSFNRNPEWSGYFSKRDELFQYFDNCADEFDIRKHIRFSTEVVEARFNSDSNLWDVMTKDAHGTHHESVNAVVSAVGQLNRPAIPEILGLDTFAGEMWHSACWRSDIDVKGKRVAVIGTGCSSVQLLPKTAEVAKRAVVFQRTPHWVAPVPDYYRSVEPGLLWALKHVPYYAEFHRARMILIYGDRVWNELVADPNWDRLGLSINAASHATRERLTGFIKNQLGSKTHYMEHCVPDYPVWGKRMIIDNGWYQTLARANVDLVTSPIIAIEPQGVRTEDGQLHEVDILILATGFHTNRFLWPMDIVGKDGQTLASIWGNSANAYKGISVPNFPNLFCLYGPNTNTVAGGNIIHQTECQIHYIMQCLTVMLDKGIDAIDVRSEINNQYNEEVQAISRTLAWGHPKVDSWYKNSDGRVVNNSPFTMQKYWEITHQIDLADYHVMRSGQDEAR
jgi:4-hydroxyacetophenone monooxygenase